MALGIVRGLFNVAGCATTEVSLAVPWLIIAGAYSHSVFDPNIGKWFVPWLLLAGGILALISRYGGVLVVVGLLAYAASPLVFFCGMACENITVTWGPGFWLAAIGATLSLGGRSWNLPPQWMEERKGIGAVVFSIGITTGVPGTFMSIIDYGGHASAEQIIAGLALVAMGFLMTVIGLSLFLSWRSPLNVHNMRRLLHGLFGKSKAR